MRQINGKELAKILENHGWQLYRIKGSHHIYKYPGRKEHISIPIHGSHPLALGLAKHLLKIAGILVD